MNSNFKYLKFIIPYLTIINLYFNLHKTTRKVDYELELLGRNELIALIVNLEQNYYSDEQSGNQSKLFKKEDNNMKLSRKTIILLASGTALGVAAYKTATPNELEETVEQIAEVPQEIVERVAESIEDGIESLEDAVESVEENFEM